MSENTAQAIGEPVKLTYQNWRGEVSERTITVLGAWFGSTEWHPEPQVFLRAYDHEKRAERDFALRDFIPTLDAAEQRSSSDVKVKGLDGWNYDMGAAPAHPSTVLISVMLRDGETNSVGEAYRDADTGAWWWAGESSGDYYAEPIAFHHGHPHAWRHLPDPAPVRALQNGGGDA